MKKPVRIAIAGLGTVGAGTIRLLHEHKDLIELRCGRPVVVVAVSARDRSRDRGVSLDGFTWFDDPALMAAEAEAEVVVELIGGSDGPAKAVCLAAIAHGRHVVTANKALLAHYGADLARAAESRGVALAYEAAVAGGIPIIKALREGLAGNRISRVYGILNGTCNYILTTMRQTGRDFADVLSEAMKLGYAESDPSFDIDGIDTAHKLAILASVAFGTPVAFGDVFIEGIRHISAMDISYAEELGYRIKLLGIARLTEHGIEQRVHPCMVPLATAIARVDGVFNAVVAEGDFVGRSVYEGRGAGAGATASAVVADIIDIACGRFVPTFGLPVGAMRPLPPSPVERRRGAYYIRLMVVDRPGVFADIAAALRDEQVSMESVLQRRRAPGESVPVVVTIHDTDEASMRRALARIGGLPAMVEPPHLIRIETL
ncbi:MAG: homoserine dehydrogenase [Alphaproteobacteria bacterium]|nr:homoserine dehydrogenase [Alphaproteobacteria bacterium]